MRVLALQPEVTTSLAGVDDPWCPWVHRATFTLLDREATADVVLSAVLEAWDTLLDGPYLGPGSDGHGPYPVGLLGASDFRRSEPHAAEELLARWIGSYVPDGAVDPAPHLAAVVRPYLSGETYLSSSAGAGPRPDAWPLSAAVLDDWWEVVTMDRVQGVVTHLTASGD